MPYYKPADEELLETARRVIAEVESHQPLSRAKIGFAFRHEAPERNGKKVLAQVRKVSDQIKHHLELDYLIWVAEDEWDKMDAETRFAVLDHEFCHCYFDWDRGWSTRDHDVQEFIDVIYRHGIWRKDLVPLAAVVQMHMPLSLDEEGELGGVVAVPVTAFD